MDQGNAAEAGKDPGIAGGHGRDYAHQRVRRGAGRHLFSCDILVLGNRHRRDLAPVHPDGPDTRLSNGFSKNIDNLYYAVALHFMHYNFGRIHKTLRVTPAMEAEVADHVWSLEEIAGLIA